MIYLDTDKILNAESMGWEYIGDGYFIKENNLGYYLENGGWRSE